MATEKRKIHSRGGFSLDLSTGRSFRAPSGAYGRLYGSGGYTLDMIPQVSEGAQGMLDWKSSGIAPSSGIGTGQQGLAGSFSFSGGGTGSSWSLPGGGRIGSGTDALTSFGNALGTDDRKERAAGIVSGLKSAGKAVGGKAGSIITGVAGVAEGYMKNAGTRDTSQLESDMTDRESASVLNYDALEDMRRTTPAYSSAWSKGDLNGSTGEKIGNTLSATAQGAKAGFEAGGPWGALAGAIIGTGAGVAGWIAGDKSARRKASHLNYLADEANAYNNYTYEHELNDIDTMADRQRMGNISADGGRIDISPSKRGTFRAQASRMGMGVGEAARHILAHKDRYSPAMVRKANFARNFAHAYGGFLGGREPVDLYGGTPYAGGGELAAPVQQRSGGWFATSPELVRIDAGGTHEGSRYGGVPMGADAQGTPNLVEEGETVWDGYVFSDRLYPDGGMLKENGLPEKYGRHTFADISERIAGKYEETPADPIAKESMAEEMDRLRTVQETVKADLEAAEVMEAVEKVASLPPATRRRLAEGLMQEQAARDADAYARQTGQRVMPEEGYGGGGPQDLYTGEALPGSGPMQEPYDLYSGEALRYAYGGRLFADGGQYPGWGRGVTFYTVDGNGNYSVDEARVRKAADSQARRKGIVPGSVAYRQIYDRIYGNADKAVKALVAGRNATAAEMQKQEAAGEAIRKGRQDAEDYLKSLGYSTGTAGLSSLTKEQRDTYRALLAGKAADAGTKEQDDLIGPPVPASLRAGTYDEDDLIGPPVPESLRAARKTGAGEGQDHSGEGTSQSAVTRPGSGAGTEKSGVQKNTGNTVAAKGRGIRTGSYAEGYDKARAWAENSAASRDAVIRKTYDAYSNASSEEERARIAGELMDYFNGMQQSYADNWQDYTRPAVRSSGVAAHQDRWAGRGTEGGFDNNAYFGDDTSFRSYGYTPSSGDSRAKGYATDGLWGPTTEIRNYGGDEYGAMDEDSAAMLRSMGISWSPEIAYGSEGRKLYRLSRSGAEEGAQQESPVEETSPDTAAESGVHDLLNPEDTLEVTDGNDRGKYPAWLRYAPAVGSGLAYLHNLFEKPDYSDADAIARLARRQGRARFQPIHEYMSYRPVDRNHYLNQVRNQGLATDRALLDASGANPSAARAALLASQYNTQNAAGSSLVQQDLANRQHGAQVHEFNRGTNQYNSQGLFDESVQNMNADSMRNSLMLQSIQARRAEKDRRDRARSESMSNFFDNLGDIGRENFARNMVATDKRFGYYTGNGGVQQYSPSGTTVSVPAYSDAQIADWAVENDPYRDLYEGLKASGGSLRKGNAYRCGGRISPSGKRR